MGKLTKNISREELACHCGCGLATVDFETVSVVQEACDFFAKKRKIPCSIVTITSAARCANHNTKVGGRSKSQHLLCRAIDFVIKGVTPNEATQYLENKYPNKYGIGEYKHFTHIDTKSGKARRWTH